jgi:uncharacterized membrane protein YkvI
MDRALTGSILLGFGILSHILAHWANEVAFSSSLPLTVLIWSMMLTGLILLILDLWKESQDIKENLDRREWTIIGIALGVLLIVGFLSFLGLRVPPF